MRRDYTCPSDSSTWEDAEATFGTVAKKVLLPIRQGEPQAFIARQAPASSIPPHFHPINQFLIIVEGGGSLGPKPLKPVTVHYTDGNTAYGPIDAGPDGLAFFNCRQISTTEAYFMPESRGSTASPTKSRDSGLRPGHSLPIGQALRLWGDGRTQATNGQRRRGSVGRVVQVWPLAKRWGCRLATGNWASFI